MKIIPTVGCLAFVDQCGGIGFNNLTNSILPDFTSFNSSSQHTLRGARPNWTKSLIVLDYFSYLVLHLLTKLKGCLLVHVTITAVHLDTFYIPHAIQVWND